MNELSQKKILILDCQTTGMHPSTGYLLQMGWSVFDPTNPEISEIHKWTLQSPLNQEIPSKIIKMLHLSDSELEQGIASQKVFDELQKVLKRLGPEPVALAHYAQFEKSFLKKFYLEHAGTDILNFQLFCSQKIAKRILPHLPSHNLKAIAGFLKLPNTPKNEVNSHVAMTKNVWQHLAPQLIAINVVCYTQLAEWLADKRFNKSPSHYEYNIERLARLELSTQPGVYRMLAKDGTVLYIGKATSLKSRVNSYFRGVKNRDRKKLEMLAQVWKIETLECESPLEAALMESDEIKKWNPPYNLLLKSDNRKLIFYNHDYSTHSEIKDATFFNGPYKPFDALMILIELLNALKTSMTLNYGNEPINPETLNNAWLIFCTMHHIESTPMEELDLRKMFLIGCALLKQFEHLHGKDTFQKWWAKEKKKNLEEDLSLEEKIAQKIGRIFIRAAEAKRKNRRMRRLSNSCLIIQSTGKTLTLINGEINSECHLNLPSNNEIIVWGLRQYDRLSILLSALNNKTITLI